MSESKPVEHFFLSTTSHGLKNIWTSHNLLVKLAWLAAFLGSFAYANKLIIEIFAEYLSQPTGTNFKIRAVPNLTLPDATICVNSKLNATMYRALSMDIDTVGMLQGIFGLPEQPILRGQRKNLSSSLIDLLATMSLTEADQFLDQTSFQCSDIFRSCKNLSAVWDCCDNAKTLDLWQIYGCFKTTSGHGFGYQIMLEIPEWKEVVPSLNLQPSGGLISSFGQSQALLHKGFSVPRGSYASVAIQAEHVRKVNPKGFFGKTNKTCDDSTDAGLRYDLCLLSCVTNRVLKVCGCHLQNKLTIKKDPTCSFQVLFVNCIHQLPSVFRNLGHCYAQCLKPCESWTYLASVTYVNFSRASLTYFYDNQTVDNIMKNHVMLDIYFDKLIYTDVQQYFTITFDTFVSNLGGQLGLFLGSSLLSVAHGILFLLDVSLLRSFRGIFCSKPEPKTHPVRSRSLDSFERKRGLRRTSGVYELTTANLERFLDRLERPPPPYY